MKLTNQLHRHYNLYLSCAWNYNSMNKDLHDLLGAREDFRYRSIYLSPQHAVFQTNDERKIYESIRSKIKFCDAVIMLCGVYSNYSRWINKEIIACKDELNIPLIAVQRFDANRTSQVMKENADVIVNWQADEIIAAIIQHANKK
ncbi:hypothetical protein E5161_12790 [Cohnella pontilimi]|uniref:Thoeris protein ThsB TIR-like domain-containing protein n=1 Tax=Cohnella pontilimi TaxID=2564100 RepID=A0A4U0F9J0_9BACL|nr:TIR domain-containing protein [Cohnella pontilimi]TJY41301.1 hypothetical protein E5161_12790 [Cohnella pontilimi]